MTSLLAPDAWVYIIVLDPGASETYFAQQDPETGSQLIPVFSEKSNAETIATRLVPGPQSPYDIHAIEVVELTEQLAGTGAIISVVDSDGRIAEQMQTAQTE